MTVNVLYFASLREQIGRSGDQFDFSQEVLTSMTVEQLWRHATAQEQFPEDILVSLNQAYTDKSASVSDGDEIAFFPPVTGG